MIYRYKNKIKKHLQDIIALKASSESIAAGFALGTFIAIIPTLGFGIIVGILLLLLFKKISKISMLAAFAVWNPLLLIPLAGLSYKIGNFLLPGVPTTTYEIELLNQIFIYSRRFLLGNLIPRFQLY